MTSVAINLPVGQAQAAAQPRVRVVKGGRYGLRRLKVLMHRAAVVLIAALVVGLIVSVVASQARITELSGQIDATRSDLTSARANYDYLSSTMSDITSRTNIQDIAEGQLGLVKADTSQMTYIKLEDESVINKAVSEGAKLVDGFRTAALSLLSNLDP